METAIISQTNLLNKILENFIITHFRKHEIGSAQWYCIGVVDKQIWEIGENGVDYIPRVFEDTDIASLYQQVINDAD